jgi:integrase
MIVPKDLQELVGKKELRYSLKTGYLGVAKYKARLLAGQVQFLFERFRKGGAVLSILRDDQIKQLVHQYIKDSIENWDRGFFTEPDDDYSGLSAYEVIDSFDEIRDQFIAQLNEGDLNVIEDMVDILVDKNEIHGVDKSSLEYRKLCAEILKAEIQLMPLHKQHMQCDFSYKDKLPGIFPEVYPQVNKAIAEIETSQSEPLTKVIEEFRKEKIQTRSWKPRTIPEADRALNHFKDNIGEKIPIHSIDGKALRQYKQWLLDEEFKPGKTRSITTINDKYLTFVKTLFVFAKDNHYIEKNPAKGLSIKVSQKKKSHKKQEIFTDEDLKKLFCESSEFGADSLTKPHHFWVPLIGLYTGMRLEEICQLYVSDLKKIGDIWYLDALEEEEHPEKSIKTGERRAIPLHPFLVNDLNFIGYVKGLPDQDGRIFPETNWVATANRYGHQFSIWFGNFRKKYLENVKPKKKTFHSLRHTLKTHLAKRGVDVLYNHYLTGHSTKDVGDDYIKPEVDLIYEKAVLKIKWDFDLSHLKKSKFVPR